MALGIVSNEELEEELARMNGDESRAEIVDLPGKGRGSKTNTPNSLRKVIGDEALESNNSEAKDLVKAIGGEISDSSISAYKQGATSTATYNERDEGLAVHVDETRVRIASKAREKLLSALDHITEEKLGNAKLREASGVARDMSGIVKDMEPPSERGTESGVKFVFFTPPMRKEESFEIIDVVE
jgi:hypothetical protein